MKAPRLIVALALLTLAAACGGSNKTPTQPTPAPPPPAAPKLTPPAPDSPIDGFQTETLRPTLTVRNGTSDQTGTRTYEFQISDRSDFTFSPSTFVASYVIVSTMTGVAEDPSGRTSYTPDQDLQPTTKLYWRARMVQASTISDWSPVSAFKTKLVGFLRAGELYDPLIHGVTVGDRVGRTTFIPGKGITLNDKFSYVRYLLPQTVSHGEYSMEVEGLAANGPGDKAKVFGMQEGQGDFITNLYRVDIQYRGIQGVPPNCIQWRAMFGSDDHKIEPTTQTRMASVYLLSPGTTYFFRATWGNVSVPYGFRLQVFEGGQATARTPFYNQWAETSATYKPMPHYAYLGAPLGRSGSESATIAGTIYRNVWLGSKPRPASLGSAIDWER